MPLCSHLTQALWIGTEDLGDPSRAGSNGLDHRELPLWGLAWHQSLSLFVRVEGPGCCSNLWGHLAWPEFHLCHSLRGNAALAKLSHMPWPSAVPSSGAHP